MIEYQVPIFLHILVFVYWLGGDLGVFYSAGVVTDENRSPAERMTALSILNNVDMAPRTAMTMTLPTGLWVAASRGWIAVPSILIWTVAVLAIAWCALIWHLHLRAHDSIVWKTVDQAVRWVVIGSISATIILQFTGSTTLPFFILAKLGLFAACVALGLVVRRELGPLVPAIGKLAVGESSPENDRKIKAVLGRTKVWVMLIWALISIAAWLGLAKIS